MPETGQRPQFDQPASRCLRTGRWLVLAALLAACAAPPTPTVTSAPAATVAPTATLSAPTPTATAPPPTLIVLGDYPRLAPEAMRSDLDELFHRLETTHPDPYARRPKTEVDQEREHLAQALAQPLTMMDFYRQVAPLVNSLGDLHTSVFPPDETLAGVMMSERAFPLMLEVEGGRAYVTGDLAGQSGVMLGSEVLSVNGWPLAALQAEAKRYFPQTRAIPTLALWLILGSPAEFAVELRPPGASTPVVRSIPSLTAAASAQAAASAGAPAKPVVYTAIPGEPIGLLTLNAFFGLGPLLKAPFTQIQADGVAHLIIDVRANSGGLYQEIDAVMDYLTDQPYRQCARRSQAPFGGYGSGAPREAECALVQPFPVEQRYAGQLYLLIGPDTFSSGIVFATILQDTGRALLIGEATRASASFCADVPTEMTPLPQTGLLLQISRTCQVRPSGHLDERGVLPAVEVKTTVAQRLAGEDPVLAYTLDLIRAGQPRP